MESNSGGRRKHLSRPDVRVRPPLSRNEHEGIDLISRRVGKYRSSPVYSIDDPCNMELIGTIIGLLSRSNIKARLRPSYLTSHHLLPRNKISIAERRNSCVNLDALWIGSAFSFPHPNIESSPYTHCSPPPPLPLTRDLCFPTNSTPLGRCQSRVGACIHCGGAAAAPLGRGRRSSVAF